MVTGTRAGWKRFRVSRIILILASCDDANMRMGKRLGQHFLTNTAIPKHIVESANIQPTDIVLEVGPGKGILTQFLVEKAKKVIAIEKDAALVRYLEEKFEDAKNLEVVGGDILLCHTKLDPASKTFKKNTGFPKNSGFRVKPGMTFITPKKYKIVANLPYYITSRFLRLFLEEMTNKPQSMVLMVQKEVAERICAKPPHMNLLALSVQAFGRPKILFRVGKGNFSPPPEIDSAVIAIENISDNFFKKHHILPQEFFKLPKKSFSQKRKMLRSSVGSYVKGGLPYVFETKRPQELTLENWTQIISK